MALSDDITLNEIETAVDVPDINAIANSFKENRVKIDPYIQQCIRNMDNRFCRWSGQSNDQRKHTEDIGGSAIPWEAASDIRTYKIDGCIKALNAFVNTAFSRMKVSANPTNFGDFDIKKAENASIVIKSLILRIPRIMAQVERLTQYMLMTGLAISYEYWEHEIQKLYKPIQLSDLPENEQQIVMMAGEDSDFEKLAVEGAKMYLRALKDESILNRDVDSDNEDDELLMSDEEIREMICELREKGKTKITYEGVVRDGCGIEALSPYERILFPAYTLDYKNAGFADLIMYYTSQELRDKENEGWDKNWIDTVIKKCRGRDSMFLSTTNVLMGSSINIYDKIKDVYQVIHRFSKVYDKETGLPVIYETVFHPYLCLAVNYGGLGEQTYAIHHIKEDALGEYPLTVTKYEEYSDRLYETRSLVEVVAGVQAVMKGFLDGNIDRTSYSILPPQYLQQNALDQDAGYVGPFTTIMVRNPTERGFMPPPQADPINKDTKRELEMLMNFLTGLPDPEIDPMIVKARLQDIMNRISCHFSQSACKFFRYAKVFGPDKMWVRVGGSSEKIMYKHDQNDYYDFTISMDSSNVSQEALEAKASMFAALKQQDNGGVITSDKYIRAMANMIDPLIADEIISGAQDSQQRSISEEDEAIAKTGMGIPLDLTPDEQRNMIKAQRFMQWYQSPPGQMASKNEVIGPTVENRAKQWKFAMQQNQNAQVGRIGTQPTNNGSNQAQ